MQQIEIWQPRYRDNTVLIAEYKVPNGDFNLIFTKAKHLKDMVFKVNGTDIKNTCSIETNGKIPCFVVPFDYLKNITNDLNMEDLDLEQT